MDHDTGDARRATFPAPSLIPALSCSAEVSTGTPLENPLLGAHLRRPHRGSLDDWFAAFAHCSDSHLIVSWPWSSCRASWALAGRELEMGPKSQTDWPRRRPLRSRLATRFVTKAYLVSPRPSACGRMVSARTTHEVQLQRMLPAAGYENCIAGGETARDGAGFLVVNGRRSAQQPRMPSTAQAGSPEQLLRRASFQAAVHAGVTEDRLAARWSGLRDPIRVDECRCRGLRCRGGGGG